MVLSSSPGKSSFRRCKSVAGVASRHLRRLLLHCGRGHTREKVHLADLFGFESARKDPYHLNGAHLYRRDLIRKIVME